ncbi:putative recombination initiation defects 3 isoform X2 [Silene latifolia]|uniref:putative recombination initiation defects 3 isoform X2 n=1 Tax=Silene latifolia TaxID=37657 RepID=UPI003D76EA72
MKLKINKACDLNSISVLPPHARSSLLPPQSQSQPRSQLSQQSFSQGMSSQQNAMFSQISQNSFDEENQRFSSQEKDNSVKRLSCLAPSSYPRDESQLPISRSSANLTRRWSSSLPEQKCQLNDELEHKFATMETLVSRLGMILDSVQSDVMQVNKGTKELSLAVEGIRQKLIAQDDSLHLLNRGQEELKTNLDVGLRSVSNQLSNMYQKDQMQEIMSTVMTFPNQIQTIVHKQAEELSKWLSDDLQAIFCSLNTLNQKHLPLAILPPKVTGGDSSQQKPLVRSEPQPTTIFNHGQFGPKTEPGGWKTVKPDRPTQSNRQGNSCRNIKQRRFSPLARPQKVVVSLDDDSDDEFSCIVVEKELDNFLLDEEAEQILKKARRRKRKQSCKRVC